MAGVQLPLDLPHRPALGGEDFLVAACNADAVGWIDRWPAWPSAGVVLYGPRASGKSHLAQVFLTRSGGRLLPATVAVAAVPDIVGESPALAIDNVEECLAENGERVVLHLLNWAKEHEVDVLLTANQPPARWDVGLADLGSRLRALPAVGIGAPDDALIAAVLAKLFADRQLRLDAAVLPYMVSRMERSFAAAEHLVAAVDRVALARKRAVSVPLVRDVMEALADKSPDGAIAGQTGKGLV